MACSAAALALAALGLAACVEAGRREAPSFYQSLAQPSARLDAAMARDMISAYRRNNGLGALALDPGLQALAEAEAQAMARAGAPASAEAVKARAAAAGLRGAQANLSAGYHTLPEAFSGWRESASHNRVMLDQAATRMGIATAYAQGSKYKVYWALVVARPP
jgi:uncharacterized protein YkwD